MSYTPYSPETELSVVGTGQSGAGVAGPGRTGARAGPGDIDMAAGGAGEALGQVLAGMRGVAGVRGFQAGIEAGQHMLGNRSFMRWVEACQSGGREAVGAQALQKQGLPAPDCNPLQLMPKKKKQHKPAPPLTTAGTGSAKAGGHAEAGKVEGGGAVPEGEGKPEAGVPLPQPEAQAAALPVEKKKKKSRVQVALNTLRGEGVAAFGGYVEAEIGEAVLLRTLVERIMRAEDLGGVRKEALGVVEGRLRLLDPGGDDPCFREGLPLAQAGGQALQKSLPLRKQGQGAESQAPELAVIAPVKSEMTPRELELFGACAEGNVGYFRSLLKHRKIDINAAAESGTLLCYAAYGGHAGIVRELLPVPGIDINACRGYKAPLHIAVETGCVEMVKLLLAAPGIDIDRQRPDGSTALYIATQGNFPEIVEQLVRWGADVNLALSGGTTPLYLAAYHGYLEVVRGLLAAPGIRVNQTVDKRCIPLAAAVQQGHKDIVRLLLRNGADPNIKSSTGWTSLQIACAVGATAIVQMLLNAGADPDAGITDPAAKRHTPDSLAEHGGHREVASILKAYRRRREAAPPRPESPTPLARAQDASREEVQSKPQAGSSSLLPQGPPLQLMGKKKKKQPAEVEAGSGEMAAGTEGTATPGPEVAQPQASGTIPGVEPEPVEGAAGGGRKKKKKSRVQVALNTLRGEGMAAFGAYIDAEIGEAEILRTLVERINRAEDLGGVRKEALGVVEGRLRLLDPGGDAGAPEAAAPAQRGQEPEKAVVAPVKSELTLRETMLFGACTGGNIRNLKRFLRHECVDVNISDEQATLLGYAVYRGHTDIVELLLKQPNIDVNLAQKEGAPPLYLAATRGHVEIVRLLLGARGINVNLAQSKGVTPLFIAAQKGYEEVVKLLLAVRGIGVDVQMSDGATALYVAVHLGFAGIVKQLVRAGADANLPLATGMTPLSNVAGSGNIEMLKILLQAPGIRVNQATYAGMVPLSIAAQRGHKEIVRLLLRERVDPNIPAQDGITALQLACLKGHTAIAEMLLHAGADAAAGINVAEGRTLVPWEIADYTGNRELMSVLAAHRQGREAAAHRRGGEATAHRRGGEATAHRPEYSLGAQTGLDADAVESEIKRHLDRAYHWFVKQAVNDMEFGRGRPVAGYPHLRYASGGVAGAGDCAVFYYLEGCGEKIRVAGIGRYQGSGCYRLDYAAAELGGVGQILHIA